MMSAEGHAKFQWNSSTEQEVQFKEIYYRNNRRGGQKNLRCFPHCGEEHNPYGFCGNSIVVEYHNPMETQEEKNLLVVAKFENSSAAKIQIGELVDRQLITSNIRSVEEPLADWMEGKKIFLAYVNSEVFEINARQNCWHYGWLRNQGNNSHQLKIYFFVDDGNGKLKCVDSLFSTNFQIASTRRKDAPGQINKQKRKPMEVLPPASVNVMKNNTDSHCALVKKRKVAQVPLQTTSFGALHDPEVLAAAENLAIIIKCASRVTIYFNLMASILRHITRPKSLEKIHNFFVKYSAATVDHNLLKKAYGEALIMIESDIKCYLAIEGMSITQLTECIRKVCEISREDTQIFSYPFENYDNSVNLSTYQIGFSFFASQINLMSQLSKNKLLNNGHLKNSFFSNSVSHYVFPINGKYTCRRDISTFYTKIRPGLYSDNALYEQVLESGFEAISVKFDGTFLKMHSEKSIIPHNFAEYELDGQPHFSAMSFMGIANSLTGRGCYEGHIGERIVSGRPILYPMLTQYYFINDGGQLKRKRVISSFIRDIENIRHLRLYQQYDENVDIETLPWEGWELLDVRQRVLYPAKWSCIGYSYLDYELIHEFEYL